MGSANSHGNTKCREWLWLFVRAVPQRWQWIFQLHHSSKWFHLWMLTPESELWMHTHSPDKLKIKKKSLPRFLGSAYGHSRQNARNGDNGLVLLSGNVCRMSFARAFQLELVTPPSLQPDLAPSSHCLFTYLKNCDHRASAIVMSWYKVSKHG
jgi:hypothetical protein